MRSFEQSDSLLPNTWIVVRIDGRGFHSYASDFSSCPFFRHQVISQVQAVEALRHRCARWLLHINQVLEPFFPPVEPASGVEITCLIQAATSLSNRYQFAKPNDRRALNLMNAAACAVIKNIPDLCLAYGVSDEYR